MSSRSSLSHALRVLASLTLALAVVLLPPSSAHAQSGMHEMPGEVQLVVDHAMHGMVAGHDTGAADVTPDHRRADLDGGSAPLGAPHEADQCCSGVCFAAFLDAPDVAPLPHADNGHDPSPLVQLAWNVTSGFLRPPNS